MNDSLDKIEKLAVAARQESAPSMDVSADVMRAVRVRGHDEESVSMSWVTGFSAAAAALAMAALIPIYLEWNDPLVTMVANISWGLL